MKRKNIIIILFLFIVIGTAVSISAAHFNGGGQHKNLMNCTNSSLCNFTDADNDGICDNCGNNASLCNGTQKHLRDHANNKTQFKNNTAVGDSHKYQNHGNTSSNVNKNNNGQSNKQVSNSGNGYGQKNTQSTSTGNGNAQKNTQSSDSSSSPAPVGSKHQYGQQKSNGVKTQQKLHTRDC